MPTYRITDPKTGRTVRLTGDSPPTEAELEDIFAKLGPSGEPPPPAGPRHPSAIFAKKAVEFLPAAGGVIGGLLGNVPGAALGGAAGESARQLSRRAMGESAPATAGEAAGGVALGGAVQGGAQAVGMGLGAGMAKAAPWLMQSAVKPTLATLKEYGTTAPKLVKTLLDEGVNVTTGGLARLRNLLDATNQEIAAAVANAPGSIAKKNVAARVAPTAQRIGRQANPTADLKAVGDSVEEFMKHPVYGGPTLSVAEAQAMKQATYQQIGKKYGEASSASIETQKALARGLKEEIAEEVPQIAALNAKDAQFMAAADAVGRRVALSGNKDPVGFAWVASHPATFLAALMDRHPIVKSMLANGAYRAAATVSKVSPQAIRAAVLALATDERGDEPPPQ